MNQATVCWARSGKNVNAHPSKFVGSNGDDSMPNMTFGTQCGLEELLEGEGTLTMLPIESSCSWEAVSKVFIMGFGNIGIALAKCLRPFGVRILATKQSWASDLPNSCLPNGCVRSPELSIQNDTIDGLVDKEGSPENLLDFASKADIVVTCLALNSETAGIVNKTFLSSMKKVYCPIVHEFDLTDFPVKVFPGHTGALLVNIARGGLLHYEAVAYHLESGHLGGLGIDVAWTEPFDPDDPILKFPNVLITPHVAGVTEYSYRTMAQVVGDIALQLHAGTPLTGIEFVN
ncbi:hypothetical protein HHK36_009200 [Tetracentron sinense]|uniref:D-isomer specific 2-hydroxyacid dehydrogenase NAD-binding domain-containing protein n=1 Tax=Tetracentron sinense TaxID=13715 RepID=A0A834ZKS4_TETSI|nr:hypothetical protein HHK36_009200 [Tetracentron sinense]